MQGNAFKHNTKEKKQKQKSEFKILLLFCNELRTSSERTNKNDIFMSKQSNFVADWQFSKFLSPNLFLGQIELAIKAKLFV